MSWQHEPASPDDESPASADIPGTALCIAILVGLCLVWPIVPANANELTRPAPAWKSVPSAGCSCPPSAVAMRYGRVPKACVV